MMLGSCLNDLKTALTHIDISGTICDGHIAKDKSELKNQPIGKRKDLAVNLYTNWEDQSAQVSKFLSFNELHLQEVFHRRAMAQMLGSVCSVPEFII
jgi:hypothetical protein